MISVLLPSRKRVELLHRTINDLHEKSSGEIDFDILVRADSDDDDTITYLNDYYKDDPSVKWIIGDRGKGYPDMYKWINELCELSDKKFLFLYNDDCLMRTDDWDKIIVAQDKLAIYKTSTLDRYRDGNLFPIIPRKIYEIWGHFSLSAHNDTWVEVISRDAGLEIPLEIYIYHDRADLTGNNEDVTYVQSRQAYQKTLSIFWGNDKRELRNHDRIQLLNYIKEHGDGIESY